MLFCCNCVCCSPLAVLCSDTAYDVATGRLSFSSVHLGCLALLQDTSAHLPYTSWIIRPSGGLGGSTVVIDLQVRKPGMHMQALMLLFSAEGAAVAVTAMAEQQEHACMQPSRRACCCPAGAKSAECGGRWGPNHRHGQR